MRFSGFPIWLLILLGLVHGAFAPEARRLRDDSWMGVKVERLYEVPRLRDVDAAKLRVPKAESIALADR